MPVAPGSLPTEHACTAPSAGATPLRQPPVNTPSDALRMQRVSYVPFGHLAAHPPGGRCGHQHSVTGASTRVSCYLGGVGATMRAWRLLCAVTALVQPWLPCEAASRYAPDVAHGASQRRLAVQHRSRVTSELIPLACKLAAQPGLCTPCAR